MDLPFDAELEFIKRACVTQTLVAKHLLDPVHCHLTYSPPHKQLEWEPDQQHSAALLGMRHTCDCNVELYWNPDIFYPVPQLRMEFLALFPQLIFSFYVFIVPFSGREAVVSYQFEHTTSSGFQCP